MAGSEPGVEQSDRDGSARVRSGSRGKEGLGKGKPNSTEWLGMEIRRLMADRTESKITNTSGAARRIGGDSVGKGDALKVTKAEANKAVD